MSFIRKILFEKLRLWHFVLLFLMFAPLSAYLLRQNNLAMIELRDKVLEVDEATGDISQVEPHLENLGNYILNHMNANAGRIELPGTYNTAVEKARLKAENSGSANSSIYARAQERCENPNVLLSARAQCIQDYVTQNSAPGSDAEELEFPNKDLYVYDFASPTWSPDVAGFSMLVTALLAITIVLLFVSRKLLPFLGRIIDRDPLE